MPTFRNKAKNDYAAAFLAWLLAGERGNEPSRGSLSAVGAQSVRLAVYESRKAVAQAPIQTLTNGQLYDEWNEACWARLRGEKIAPKCQARLDAIEAELSTRPAEREAA